MRSTWDFIISLRSQDLGKHYSPYYTKGHEVSVPRSPAGITGPLKQRNLQSYKNLHLHIQGVNNSPEVAQNFCGPAGNWIHVSEFPAQVQPPHLPAVPANTVKYLFCPFTSHRALSDNGWLHPPAPAGPSGAAQWMRMFPAQQPFFHPFWLL